MSISMRITSPMFVALCAVSATAQVSVTLIPSPNGSLGAQPTCISGDGQVIYGDAAGLPFVWRSGTGSTFLPALGGEGHVALTNSDGSIAVGWADNAGVRTPTRWAASVPGALPTNGSAGEALGLSADGHQTVGFIGASSSGAATRAASWTDGGSLQFRDVGMGWTASRVLDASADGSHMVGSYLTAATGSDRHMSLYTPTAVRELPPPLDYYQGNPRPFLFDGPASISDDGQTVLAQFISPVTANYQIFRWTAATDMWTSLGFPQGESSVLMNAMSADGNTLIGSAQRHAQLTGFVWNRDAGWFNLDQFLVNAGLPSIGNPIIGTGISDDGLRISAWANQQGYLITIPTPASGGVLLAMGLVAGRRRRV